MNYIKNFYSNFRYITSPKEYLNTNYSKYNGHFLVKNAILQPLFKENYCTHKPKLNFEELKGHNEDNKQIKFTSNTAILVLFFIIDFAILYKILNESTS